MAHPDGRGRHGCSRRPGAAGRSAMSRFCRPGRRALASGVSGRILRAGSVSEQWGFRAVGAGGPMAWRRCRDGGEGWDPGFGPANRGGRGMRGEPHREGAVGDAVLICVSLPWDPRLSRWEPIGVGPFADSRRGARPMRPTRSPTQRRASGSCRNTWRHGFGFS